MDGFEVMPMVEAAKIGDFFVTVTGCEKVIDEEHIKEVLEICNNIKHDGYYVKMVVAWAVAEALTQYYDITIAYLKDCNLDDFTYNKALQKGIESFRINDEQKVQLRNLKK